MPIQEKRIIAVMTDLFFSVKISDIAKRFGMPVEFVKDKATALEKIKAKPSVVIFDLNCDAAEPIELIKAIKGDPETKRVSTIGFVSHVQTDLKMLAQQSGCDMVVARSVFAQNLPDILKRHATITVAARN
ncbi:MAG: response regulator [Acidobacteriota bacterium]|nr:response regulator [Acidobacteriota bacterium]